MASASTIQSDTDGTGEKKNPNLFQRENFHSYMLMCISPLSPGVLSLDPWLEPYKDALKSRFSYAQSWVTKINEAEGGLEKFSRVCLLETRALHTLKYVLFRSLLLFPTLYDISC